MIHVHGSLKIKTREVRLIILPLSNLAAPARPFHPVLHGPFLLPVLRIGLTGFFSFSRSLIANLVDLGLGMHGSRDWRGV